MVKKLLVFLLIIAILIFFIGCRINSIISVLTHNKVNFGKIVCLTASNVYCGEDFQKFIPCRTNLDCVAENMHTYCAPDYATLLKCINANYFCGVNGYCKASVCD